MGFNKSISAAKKISKSAVKATQTKSTKQVSSNKKKSK